MEVALGALRPNPRRLMQHIETLATMTVRGNPYTRRAFSDEYRSARRWLAQRFEEAGLQVSVDAGGNLVGRRPGSTHTTDVAVGSHIDTVTGGGRFDGVLGVLAALECAYTMAEHHVKLRHGLRVIDFLSEEPSDHGVFFVGSQALTGRLSQKDLARSAPTGESLADSITRIGGYPEKLNEALVKPGEIAVFVELHIEQGPVLEAESVDIGVVEGIVGIVSKSIRIMGNAGHAGTTPMAMRRDALVAASRLIGLVDANARRRAVDDYFVATVGRLDVRPNGANVVPGEVVLTLEARSLHLDAVEQFFEDTLAQAGEDLSAHGFELEVENLGLAEPTICSPRVVRAIEASSKQRGLNCRRMVSGAGHDAMIVSHVAPVGMIFVPCKDGLSHHPDEYATEEALVRGTQVLIDTLIALDS